MKIVNFLVLLSALTLFGCGGGSGDTPVAPALTPIMDISACRGDTPSGSTIYGKWIAPAQINQLIVVTTLTIEAKDTKSSVVCQTAAGPVDPKSPINTKAQSTTTELMAPSTVSGNQLILTASSPTTPPVPAQDPACSKTLNAGTYNVSFPGKCLLLSTDTQNFFFVRP